MKLPYNSIFRSGGIGEDSDKNACGLSRAFMRFLLSVADFPHTYWDSGDNRVVLSDEEVGLIESGIAAMSQLSIIGACNMLVISTELTADFPVSPNVSTVVPFPAGTINQDFVTYNAGGNSFTVNVGGAYSIVGACLVRFPTMPAADFSQAGIVAVNGVTSLLNENFRLNGRIGTVVTPGIVQLQAGDALSMFYYHTASQNISLQLTRTLLRVLYHG